MVKDRSDKIKDPLVKVENNLNVQNINGFSDRKSYNHMKRYNGFGENTKKIEKDILETENYYKGNKRIIEKTSNKMTSDTPSFDRSRCSSVEGKAGRKNGKERLAKCDSKNFTPQNERLQFSGHTTQRHSQTLILKTSDQKPKSRVSPKTVDSNRNKKNGKIAHQNRHFASNSNCSIQQNHSKCSEKYVEERLNVTMNKLNLKEYGRSDKKDNQPEKMNIKTSAKHSFEKSARNGNFKYNGEMATTSHYTESLEQAKDESYFITRRKKLNVQFNTNIDEIKTVSIPEQLTLDSELVSNCKTLIDESIDQTHYFKYTEETPLNTNLGIQIEEATSRVEEQLTINGKAYWTDEVKDYTEMYAIPGHNGSTQIDVAMANNFEHTSEYYWCDNSYLPYRPVTAYSFHPYAPDFAPVAHFNGNTSLFNQHLYNGGLINEYSPYEFPNVSSCDQLTYQPTYFEQNAEYLTNWQNSYNLTYRSENLNSGYSQPFVIPRHENGMVYYQYYPGISSV